MALGGYLRQGHRKGIPLHTCAILAFLFCPLEERASPHSLTINTTTGYNTRSSRKQRTKTSLHLYSSLSQHTQYTVHLRLHRRQNLDLQILLPNPIILRTLRTLRALLRTPSTILARPLHPRLSVPTTWKRSVERLGKRSARSMHRYRNLV